MPTHQHPFAKKLVAAHHRLTMTKLLEEKDIIVSDFEIKQKRTSYTVDTLEKLAIKYPNESFSWIFGSDQLDSFQKYKEWQKLVREHNLIIFPRETMIAHLEEKTKFYLGLSAIPQNITLLNNSDLILTNLSSTRARARLAKHDSLEYIIPKSVVSYIRKHKLYQE